MEDYLDKCLTSLVLSDSESELMYHLEVIVVNDGSIDRSSEIAHSYEAKYPNTFKVIDKENGNYGSCINVGLQIATGQYIKILDADDSFDTATFKRFLEFLNNVDVDAVINDYDIVNLSGEVTETFSYSALSVGTDFVLSNMSEYYCDIQMRSVTYRTELVRDIDYHQSEGLFYTDQEWIFFPLSQSKCLQYFPGRLYKYLIGREGQTVNIKVWKKSFWMEIQVLRKMLLTYTSHINSIGHDYLQIRILDRFNTIFNALLFYIPSAKNEAEVRKFDYEFLKLCPDLHSITNLFFYPLGHKYHFYYVRLWRFGVSRRGIKFFMSVVFFYNHHICREVPSKPSLAKIYKTISSK